MEYGTKANGVKKATTRNSRIPKRKKVETKFEPYVGTSVGKSMTGKKSVTKMKSLRRKHVQASDFDSDVDEDWVRFLESGGRFGQ